MTVQDDNNHTDAAYEASVKFIDEVTRNCDEMQTNVLNEILTQNTETEYLKRHGMVHGGGVFDRERFKKYVPIITYEDVKSDIMRIYNGDYSPILCAKPISELWISTGTSEGQEKLLPATDEEKVRRANLFTNVLPYLKRRIDGPGATKGKGFSLLITREETRTPNGLLLCSGLTSVFKNPRFYHDQPYPNNTNTSPMEAIHCPDHFQSVYTQLLCGFYQRHDVSHAKAVFGSSIIWAIHFLKRHYNELCDDIESGILGPKIRDPDLRACMVKTFMRQPEPELARVIREACMCDNWEGIFGKIWPNIRYVETVVTGSMSQYIPMLNYYSGGLPLVCVKYSSSECDLGFNLDPMCDPRDVSYTLMPNMAYYEFIPLELSDYGSSGKPPQTVDLASVEVGKEYELLITTYCGLYRYKVGDVLSPTGFYNSTPQFKFVRRKNVLLSMDLAKTTEIELQTAIEKASSILASFNTQIIDYTSCAEVKNTPGHYVVYLELMSTSSDPNNNNGPTSKALEQCCSAMEGALGVYYRWCRADESIGPLEIRVVKNGTFERVRDYAISKGSSFTQFKMPRCVKHGPILELLNLGVRSTHFSPSVPRTPTGA